jgi:hypothetical protein
VSNRVIAYYEGETKYPPAHLLIPIAKTLRMSLDELMGIKEESLDHNPQFANIWRRLKKTEQLPKKDQKALLHFMDALLAKNKD